MIKLFTRSDKRLKDLVVSARVRKSTTGNRVIPWCHPRSNSMWKNDGPRLLCWQTTEVIQKVVEMDNVFHHCWRHDQ